jgi:tetratricopeptide (TPR) repeat protein
MSQAHAEGALERAQLLIQQGRFSMAREQLHRVLAEQPEDPLAMTWMALCLSQEDQHEQALSWSDRSIAAAPDTSYPHFVRGLILSQEHRYDQAEASLNQAIRLDPENSDYYGVLAQVYLGGQRWAEALQAADEGLACEAQDTNCLNARAAALVKLGRGDEAEQTLRGALARDPEDANTHANAGWAALHKGQTRQALESFEQALRYEPGHDWAKAGLVEALKARNPLYRLMLGYFLWMSQLSDGARFGIIIGGYVGYRLLGNYAAQNPGIQPLVMPVLVTYLVFALLTWVAQPLFNLLLRLHPKGRHALTGRQRLNSTVFGLMAAGALGLWGIGWLPGSQPFVWNGALLLGLLILPVSATLESGHRRPSMTLSLMTGGLVVLAGAHLVGLIANWQTLASRAFLGFVLGLLAFMLMFNFVVDRRR